MGYNMAVRGMQQLVKEWEMKKLEVCLTSQEDYLVESLMKKEYSVFLESNSDDEEFQNTSLEESTEQNDKK